MHVNQTLRCIYIHVLYIYVRNGLAYTTERIRRIL